MTMQDPLATLAKFSPSAGGIIDAATAGSNILTADLNRDLVNRQLEDMDQQKLAQEEQLKSQTNIQNTAANLTRLNTALDQGAQPEQLAALLQQNIQRAQANGGNGADSQEALQVLQSGGVEALRNLAGQATAVFQQQGIFKVPATPESAFAKLDRGKFETDSVAVFERTGKYSDLVPISAQTEDPAYTAELRKELRTDVGGLVNEAKVLKTNFGKLNNLAEEMRSGNRSAVAQGLVSLVKLGDPGSVVKEEELKQALGSQSPVAAVADALRGRGVNDGIITAITQSLDPLNPGAVNVDQILATAEAMLKPNIDTITSAYGDAKSRASGQLTQGGLNSIFGQRDGLFDEIAGLSFGASTPAVKEFTTQSGHKYTVE